MDDLNVSIQYVSFVVLYHCYYCFIFDEYFFFFELLCLMLNIFGFCIGCFFVKYIKINNNSWNLVTCFFYFFIFFVPFFPYSMLVFSSIFPLTTFCCPLATDCVCLGQNYISFFCGWDYPLIWLMGLLAILFFFPASLTFITSLINIFLYFLTNPCIVLHNQSMLNSLSL